MIHNSKLLDCADALHQIEYEVDLLKISLLVNEFYRQEKFVLSQEELVDRLVFLAISNIQLKVKSALKAIDFQTVDEIRLEYRAMQECNSRSGDEKIHHDIDGDE
jgi:hypothetical protein